MISQHKAGVFTPPGRKPWDHERHAADALAQAGHYVEFLIERTTRTPDIRIDHRLEYEIKSPEKATSRTIEHIIKKALKQSSHIIICAYRIKGLDDKKMKNLLTFQVKNRKQIKSLLYITKRGDVIDISNLA